MNFYKAINKSNQSFYLNNYSIVPIRMEDRYLIMKWRNEQIYHLRQNKVLTTKDQDDYFENVVKKLFEEEFPTQLLFSYLDGETCIGYGGIVHINWQDRNAELSFVLNTSLEKDYFKMHYSNFLILIDQVIFGTLNFHKLFTYAFDLRPHLYPILEGNGFMLDARLKEHVYYNNKFLDVVIHYKLNPNSKLNNEY